MQTIPFSNYLPGEREENVMDRGTAETTTTTLLFKIYHSNNKGTGNKVKQLRLSCEIEQK